MDCEQGMTGKYVAPAIVRVGKSKYYPYLKRALDIVFSLIGIIVLFFPMLVIFLTILFSKNGHPIYSQERLGKDGVPFMIYKFRSMIPDAEAGGMVWAEADDSRCTPIGRVLRATHLDEMPQLFNILLGHMSFVGPRPERAHFYDEFDKYIDGFRSRLCVPQGLTGLAQVSGPYDLPPEKKIIFDVQYINEQSLLLDIKCIVKTFTNFLKK